MNGYTPGAAQAALPLYCSVEGRPSSNASDCFHPAGPGAEKISLGYPGVLGRHFSRVKQGSNPLFSPIFQKIECAATLFLVRYGRTGTIHPKASMAGFGHDIQRLVMKSDHTLCVWTWSWSACLHYCHASSPFPSGYLPSLLFVIVIVVVVANDDLTPLMDCFDYDNDCWRRLWT